MLLNLLEHIYIPKEWLHATWSLWFQAYMIHFVIIIIFPIVDC
jgi:hypothetical protein